MGPEGPEGSAIVSSYLRVITGEDFSGVRASVVGNVLVWNAFDYVPLDQIRDPDEYFTPSFVLENFSYRTVAPITLTVGFGTTEMVVTAGVPSRGTDANSPFRLAVVNEDGDLMQVDGTFAPPVITAGVIQMAGVASSVTIPPGESVLIGVFPFDRLDETDGSPTQWLGTVYRRAYIDLSYTLAGGASRQLSVPMVLFRHRAATRVPRFAAPAVAHGTDFASGTGMNATGQLRFAAPELAASPVHGVTDDFAEAAPTGYVIQSVFTGNPGTGAITGLPIGTPVAAGILGGTLPPVTSNLLSIPIAGVPIPGAAATQGDIDTAIDGAVNLVALRDALIPSGWHWVTVVSQGGQTALYYPGRPELQGQVISLDTARAAPFLVFSPAAIPTPVVTLTDSTLSIMPKVQTDPAQPWVGAITFQIFRGNAGGAEPTLIGTVTQAAMVAATAPANDPGRAPLYFNLLAPGELAVNQPAQTVPANSAQWLPVADLAIADRLWASADNSITVRALPVAAIGIAGMVPTALHGLSDPSAPVVLPYARR